MSTIDDIQQVADIAIAEVERLKRHIKDLRELREYDDKARATLAKCKPLLEELRGYRDEEAACLQSPKDNTTDIDALLEEIE